ncbi:hypothetical protein [Bacillus thuringiensis]|uniref:hypothetical protein n=1 Tax=Bacillus thuringiensis TaxID=1428 RepID=UPI0011A88413|nr:hypothetical protein [Bacillus thuringiensis]
MKMVKGCLVFGKEKVEKYKSWCIKKVRFYVFGGGCNMMFFDLNDICEFGSKEGFKVIKIGEIDELEYENRIYLKGDKYVLENLF